MAGQEEAAHMKRAATDHCDVAVQPAAGVTATCAAHPSTPLTSQVSQLPWACGASSIVI